MSNRLPCIGDEVRHKVTGFTGIATSHAKHISGCDTLFVEPKVDTDGKHRDGRWADIDLLEIVTPAVVEPIVYQGRAPGGVDLPAPR